VQRDPHLDRLLATSTAISSTPITFTRLLAPGDPVAAQEFVTSLGLHERSRGVPLSGANTGGQSDERAGERSGSSATGRVGRPSGPERPYVLLNVVATVDGRATLDGRSGPLSGPADRALFHGLRSVVDAVMAGAGTMRTERYGPIVPDPERRRLRAERGLAERPLACVVSASLAGLTSELPLLADADSRVIVLTQSPQTLPAVAADVAYVRARATDGSLDLPAALIELHDRLHVRTLLCEGGPHLNAQLLSAGLVDELFLSISPLLAGGGGPPGETVLSESEPPLRILAGPDLSSPAQLQLCSALEHDSHLFLRYRVRDGG
jgi:riboflavin biosynthesis pyrimidine reductase